MDPERQWIARLEPETPEDEEALDESPLGRVAGEAAGGAVVVASLAHVLGYFEVDLGIIRIVAPLAAGTAVALIELIRRRQRARLAEP